ncbi:MAG: hypothetical protein KBD78_03945 [Oligoflexales bacterium]|nr:hypothetical protein [Oligoflexales bacterium]
MTLPSALVEREYNAFGEPVSGQVAVKSMEQQAPGYEDNTRAVAATAVKPLSDSTYCWSHYANYGSAVTQNVKASTGNVGAIYCHNLNASIRYLQLHNTATTPAGGSVPEYSFLVPPSGVLLIDKNFFGEAGKNFSNGIAMAFSTTEGTYTAGTAADQVTFVEYK